MLIYLAGPIGNRPIEEANAWRKEATNRIYWANSEVINPLRGKVEHLRSTYVAAEIVTRDKKDIRKADIVLVYWPEKCVSNGTAMEIIYAHQHEKPIVFVGEWAKDDYWISYHVTKIVAELEEAYEAIYALS
jgi:nucleoside 2-deoxyribosyltransferase